MSRQNFFMQILDNIKQEMNKNKEMKEHLKKFREEAAKLDQSDALKKAREKYETIEKETSRGSETLKKTFDSLQENIKGVASEVEKSEFAKATKEVVSDMSQKAQRLGQNVAKQSEQLAQSPVIKSVAQGVKTVSQEINEAAFSHARIYKPPAVLRKRENSEVPKEEKVFEANTDATEMVMHKDSKWFQSWQNFKDKNQFVHKLFDMKTKYDESDHILVRATRSVTDKVSDLFGGLFSKTELSEVLTEIVKMDPTFEKEKFVHMCRDEFIPNILEALVRGELEILKDWCYEAPFNVISQPIQLAQAAGNRLDCRVLDIGNVDLAAGKMMEQGPVLIISFTSQQIMLVRNSKGDIVEGDPNKITRMFYVWAFCRDQNILDPKAAWKLIDLSAQPTEQWL